jgi:hypothetical protein
LAVQKEATMMGDQLKAVMGEFSGFIQQGSQERVAVDSFSSPFGFVVFERCRSQLEMLASAPQSLFFEFMAHIMKPGDETPTGLIDRIVYEMHTLGFNENQTDELNQSRIQLREKLR